MVNANNPKIPVSQKKSSTHVSYEKWIFYCCRSHHTWWFSIGKKKTRVDHTLLKCRDGESKGLGGVRVDEITKSEISFSWLENIKGIPRVGWEASRETRVRLSLILRNKKI